MTQARTNLGFNTNYSYTNDGYLQEVTIRQSDQTVDALRSRRANDELGRVKVLTEWTAGSATGTGQTVSYSKTSTYDVDSRVSYENGTDGATSYFYAANGGELERTANLNGGTTITTYYGYELWDDAKITAIQAQGYNPKLKKNNRIWRPGYSDISYDVNGHISGAVDWVGNRHFTYVNDSNGQIMVRDEITGARDRVSYRTKAYQDPGSVASKITRYYYVDGKRVGDISNDGPSRTDYAQALANRGAPQGNNAGWTPVASADFDQNYEPISPTYPGAVASSYTVKNGDSLQSIARTVWGDSAMWYLIADANGLASGSSLVAGQMLIIPNKVANINNNAGTFRPYNPGEAIGDTSPTLPVAPSPPKKKKKCGGLGAILVAVVTIAVTVLTKGALGNVAAAALGNLAGQATGNIIGTQKGFDFKSFGTAVLTAGIGELAPIQALKGGLGEVLGKAIGNYGATAANAIVGNVLNQGVGTSLAHKEALAGAV